MKREAYFKKLKSLGTGWIPIGIFSVLAAILIAFGILMCVSPRGEPQMAALLIIIGVFGLGLFLIMPLTVLYIQASKSIDQAQLYAWPEGQLTEAVIVKDYRSEHKEKSTAAILSALTMVLLIIICWLLSDRFLNAGSLFSGAGLVVCIVFLIWSKCKHRKLGVYRIVEDTLLKSEVQKEFSIVDAVTTHTPTTNPTLYFEKHGQWLIDSTKLHSRLPGEIIIQQLEPGEEMYIVYKENSNKIVHIYRKKHWHR